MPIGQEKILKSSKSSKSPGHTHMTHIQSTCHGVVSTFHKIHALKPPFFPPCAAAQVKWQKQTGQIGQIQIVSSHHGHVISISIREFKWFDDFSLFPSFSTCQLCEWFRSNSSDWHYNFLSLFLSLSQKVKLKGFYRKMIYSLANLTVTHHHLPVFFQIFPLFFRMFSLFHPSHDPSAPNPALPPPLPLPPAAAKFTRGQDLQVGIEATNHQNIMKYGAAVK